MTVSFKNRIAFHYMIATALIMAIVFFSIYLIVEATVYRNLDADLSFEANKHMGEIKISGHSVEFINKSEWEEREHREIQVNPVFIQLIDEAGKVTDKSPNLKDNVLPIENDGFSGHFNATLNERNIRVIKIPIEEGGKTKGYILAAISSESAQSVISKLRNTLLLSYLVLLFGLYFISRLLAGRSIIPIKNITQTINRITKNNLNERVQLPPNKDELYDLANSFNDLLGRIERALDREKQFTSDASHELRTPLAILRGTLEVLIRQPRSQEEYEEKVKFSLKEINRMTDTLEQLFQLARIDGNIPIPKLEQRSLATLIDETLQRYNAAISKKELRVDLIIDTDNEALVNGFYSDLIIDNIISNAVKYSSKKGLIHICIEKVNGKIRCRIKDNGIGINEKDIENIYNNFFRSEALSHKSISGDGLGLSIAKKAADAINARISVSSKEGSGSTFTIEF